MNSVQRKTVDVGGAGRSREHLRIHSRVDGCIELDDDGLASVPEGSAGGGDGDERGLGGDDSVPSESDRR